MPKLVYITLVRFPTEKAHGLQIAQNAEAFVEAGYDVELWINKRKNTAEMQAITDPYTHYGVKPIFKIRGIPSLDLYPLIGSNPRLEYFAFYLNVFTYCLFLLWRVLFEKADIYYSRDAYVLLALSLLIPKEKLVFEVHQFSPSRLGGWIQSQAASRVGHIIAITPKLKADFVEKRGANAESILVAHDGVKAERFAQILNKSEARKVVAWDEDAFIVGYMGRLHTMGMDKGVGLMIEAAAQLENVYVALVGGPDDMAEVLRQNWLRLGRDEKYFLNAGTVPSSLIPIYLAAFDVCAMPFPWNEHYAFYMSPLKLFEYMASARPLIASDLPSISDVVQHEQDAILVPPSDILALKAAIQALRDNPQLAQKISQNAREKVLTHYTWDARAEMIRAHIERAIMPTKAK